MIFVFEKILTPFFGSTELSPGGLQKFIGHIEVILQHFEA